MMVSVVAMIGHVTVYPIMHAVALFVRVAFLPLVPVRVVLSNKWVVEFFTYMADYLCVATIFGLGMGYSHYKVILAINYVLEIADERPGKEPESEWESESKRVSGRTGSGAKLHVNIKKEKGSGVGGGINEHEPFPSPKPALKPTTGSLSDNPISSSTGSVSGRNRNQPVQITIDTKSNVPVIDTSSASEGSSMMKKKPYTTPSPTNLHHHHHLHVFHNPVVATPPHPDDEVVVSRISGIKAPHFNPNAVVSPESPREYDIEPLEQLVEEVEAEAKAEQVQEDVPVIVEEPIEECEVLPTGRRSSIGNLESINEEEEGEEDDKSALLLGDLEGLSPRTSARRRPSSLFEDIASSSIGDSSYSQEEVIDEFQESSTNSAATGSEVSDEIFSLNRHHTTVNTEQMPSEAQITKEFQKYKDRIK